MARSADTLVYLYHPQSATAISPRHNAAIARPPCTSVRLEPRMNCSEPMSTAGRVCQLQRPCPTSGRRGRCALRGELAPSRAGTLTGRAALRYEAYTGHVNRRHLQCLTGPASRLPAHINGQTSSAPVTPGRQTTVRMEFKRRFALSRSMRLWSQAHLAASAARWRAV